MGAWMRMKKSWAQRYETLIHESGSPDYIARGWAIGVMVAWVVPVGTQIALALPLAFLLKGSKVGAIGGTLHSNIFTIWFCYPLQCYLGNKLIGGVLSYPQLERLLERFMKYHDLRDLWALGSEVLLSFLAGGALLAAITTPLVYLGVYALVRHYRREQA